jgi:uncharacterized membrane protein YdjX (TVP38/TMEM64 family)
MIGEAGPLASRAAPAGPPSSADVSPGASASWFVRAVDRLKATSARQRWLVLLSLAALAAFVVFWQSVDKETFYERAKAWPAATLTTLVGVLPLAGVPVSALHLAAGLRFEFWPALLVVGAATLFQHVAAWVLVRALPDRYFSRLGPWRERLEGAGHRETAVLCCLIPGMPYTVQMYLLPVMGISLRIICLISAPLHTARATVTILLGNVSDDLTPPRVAGLAVYYLAIFAICALTLRRMRRSLDVKRAGRIPGESPGAPPMGAQGGKA